MMLLIVFVDSIAKKIDKFLKLQFKLIILFLYYLANIYNTNIKFC
jgi:hypothetical protein